MNRSLYWRCVRRDLYRCRSRLSPKRRLEWLRASEQKAPQPLPPECSYPFDWGEAATLPARTVAITCHVYPSHVERVLTARRGEQEAVNVEASPVKARRRARRVRGVLPLVRRDRVA